MGGWLRPHPGRFTPKNDLLPIVLEGGGLVECGKFDPTGVLFPDRPARSKSL